MNGTPNLRSSSYNSHYLPVTIQLLQDLVRHKFSTFSPPPPKVLQDEGERGLMEKEGGGDGGRIQDKGKQLGVVARLSYVAMRYYTCIAAPALRDHS